LIEHDDVITSLLRGDPPLGLALGPHPGIALGPASARAGPDEQIHIY